MTERNIAASVRSRLLNHARGAKLDFNLVLTRFCLERLLYRVSISRYSDQFLLKGALLFDLWFDVPHRPTRDIDFLGFGSSEVSSIEQVFRDICDIDVRDGVVFMSDTVRAAEIRKDANYSGVRVTLNATLDNARCHTQIDIGFGDAVTPGPQEAEYPIMLDGLGVPKLRVYPRYTVAAEKFEALSVLGMSNSRMKDYFDLWFLSCYADFDGDMLSEAIKATFCRRESSIPKDVPLGLTRPFSTDLQKQKQWQAFLNKSALEAGSLGDIVDCLAGFLMPVVNSINTKKPFSMYWVAGGLWKKKSD